MKIGRIADSTRVLAVGQGDRALPVRDGWDIDPTGIEPNQPTMRSAWLPSPFELEQLNAGGAIVLVVVGSDHPSVRIEVGRPCEPNEVG
jgi:hypothetical protein